MPNFNLDNFRSLELPSEIEIMSDWQGDLGEPLVSVMCLAYNHQHHIEDAIRGFLIQRTDFPFEIVIHDDASTDNTQEIIKQYAERYPNLIKPILQTENQRSQGKKVSRIVARHCRAEILAICEGDDFWIDPRKLAVQTKTMIANPRSTIIVHPCYTMDGNNKCQVAYTKGDDTYRFDAQDVLNISPGFAPTASYMIKRRVYDVLPAWLDTAPVGDLFLELYSLKIGIGIYIPDVMCVYRTFSVGSWTDKMRKADGKDLISHAHKLDTIFTRMQEDSFFSRLNFNAKRSGIHVALATGCLLNNDDLNFKKHILRSYALHPDCSLTQKVFMALRWYPAVARLFYKSKREFKLFFKLG